MNRRGKGKIKKRRKTEEGLKENVKVEVKWRGESLVGDMLEQTECHANTAVNAMHRPCRDGEENKGQPNQSKDN